MFSPTVTAVDVAGANALIALITDPKAAKQRLDDIAEATAKHQALVEEAAEHRRAAESAFLGSESNLAEAVRLHDETKTSAAQIDGASKRLSDQAAKRDAESAGREAAVQAREEAHAKREAKWNEETAVTSARLHQVLAAHDERQVALDRREKELSAREAAHEAAVADHADRVYKLKALVN
jgi:hypothetical protein